MWLHEPSFEEKGEGTEGTQRWFSQTKGLTIPPWIPSILFFSVLDLEVVKCVGGEISPTLILVPAFIQNKNKGGNKKNTLPVLNIEESKFLLKQDA